MLRKRNDFLVGRVLIGLVLPVAVLALAGCGGSGKAKGSVSGQVTHNSQPVTEGEVHFFSKDRGVGAVAKIDGSGKYALADLETGKYTIHVTPPPPIAGDPKLGPPKASASKIPQKARDAATSGLSYTVVEGKNDHNIELKD
jgi:hypothetical protein